MLAFLDSPVQLIIAAVVILIVFGPQKLPEIAGQIGRALRELKRTTSDLQDSFNLDHNRYEEHYNPPSYDTYGNPTSSTEPSTTSTIPESDVHYSSLPATNTHSAITANEPVRGDFASSALADAGSEYGYAPSVPNSASGGASAYTAASNVTAPGTAAAREVELRPAEGSVPRQS